MLSCVERSARELSDHTVTEWEGHLHTHIHTHTLGSELASVGCCRCYSSWMNRTGSVSTSWRIGLIWVFVDLDLCVCVIAQEEVCCRNGVSGSLALTHSILQCVCGIVWPEGFSIDFDSGCVSMLWSEGLYEGLERRNTDVTLQGDEMIDPL